MRCLVIAVACASLSCVRFVSPAAAQSVLVQVTAAESGKPLPGAFVSLLDDHGRATHSALTNESGGFLFAGFPAGRFRVRAEMIGRETLISSPLSLREGESGRVPMALAYHAIPLAEIRVHADERCRLRPDEASEIAQVWEAARKALAVQAWTEQKGLYRLDISTYDRDLDRAGRKVERENRRARTTVTRNPFASLPPEDLSRDGFIRQLEDGGYQYYAPDAAMLLSDHFLDTHCFRLTRSRDFPGSIGLAFEPVRKDELADIQGTLWLNESTAYLRVLEYHYTWTPYEEARGIAEGRVEFEAMPNGAWIIGRWWIRAPIIVRRANLARAADSGIRVAGIRETGGEVVGVSTLARHRITQLARGSLRGLVWDSTGAGPLAGASVFLSGTAYAATTDREGRFVLDGLPAGVFTASFTHPRLDSLGIPAPAAEAEVTHGKAAEIGLAIPAQGTILLAMCRAEERETGAAVLSGIVSDLTTGEPIPGATVRVEWQAVERTRPIVQATQRWLEVRTDGEGRYTACGIPAGEAIRIHASFLQYRGEVALAGFSEEAHEVRDLQIELPRGSFASRTAVSAPVVETGVQGIQGVLVERESGSPVRNAEITIRSAAGQVVASDVTNERGFFRLRTPTPGRFLLTAQALGYGLVAGETVEVARGALAVLEIHMVPEAVALEPLVVTAAARAFQLELEGFYRRHSDRGDGSGKGFPARAGGFLSAPLRRPRHLHASLALREPTPPQGQRSPVRAAWYLRRGALDGSRRTGRLLPERITGSTS